MSRLFKFIFSSTIFFLILLLPKTATSEFQTQAQYKKWWEKKQEEIDLVKQEAKDAAEFEPMNNNPEQFGYKKLNSLNRFYGNIQK